MSEVLKNINKQSFTTKEAANYIGVSEYSLRASRMKDHLLLSAPPPKAHKYWSFRQIYEEQS